jgi:hypothetical protein
MSRTETFYYPFESISAMVVDAQGKTPPIWPPTFVGSDAHASPEREGAFP